MSKTIKQIADELGVSKQAVRNEIEKQGLQSTLQKNANQLCIDENTEILIKSAILKRRGANLHDKVSQSIGLHYSEELHQARIKIAELQLELKLQKANEKEKVVIQLAEIERLCDELKSKDELINAQLQQLSDLSKLMAATQQQLSAAQALHAGTLSQALPPKRHWWQKQKPPRE